MQRFPPQDMFSTIDNAVKLVIANKVDKAAEREVAREQGSAFARQHGTLFVETSAKANTAVSQAFEELVAKIMETPSLLENVGAARLHVGSTNTSSGGGSCCS